MDCGGVTLRDAFLLVRTFLAYTISFVMFVTGVNVRLTALGPFGLNAFTSRAVSAAFQLPALQPPVRCGYCYFHTRHTLLLPRRPAFPSPLAPAFCDACCRMNRCAYLPLPPQFQLLQRAHAMV